MGLREHADAMQRRDQRAVSLIGPFAVKTAGGLVIANQHRVADGWLYAGRDALCFLADDATQLLTAEAPGRVDGTTLVIAYQDCSEPVVTAPGAAPNAIVDFGGGREFVGPQGRLLEIMRMWFLWAASTHSAEDDWEARYLAVGAPLRSTGLGIPRRTKSLLALVCGLVAAGIGIGRLSNTPDSTALSTVLVGVGSLVVFGIASRIVLMAVPRWGRGNW